MHYKKAISLFIFLLSYLFCPAQQGSVDSLINKSFKKLSDNQKFDYLFKYPFNKVSKSRLQEAFAFFDKETNVDKDKQAFFYLLYLQYHHRRALSLKDEKVYSLLNQMQTYAKENNLPVQQLIANHCQIFTKYFKKSISVEATYAEVIKEVDEIKKIGVANFKPYDVDDVFYQTGKFLFYLDEKDKALEHLIIAEQYVDDDFHTHILILNLIQTIYQQKNDNTNGIVYGKKLLSLVSRANYTDSAKIKLANQWKGISSMDIAAMLVDEGKPTEGEKFANEAYPFVRAKKENIYDYNAEFEALLVMVSLKLKQHKLADAATYLKRMDSLYQTVGQTEYLYFKRIKYFELYRHYYEAIKDYEKSVHYLHLAQPLKDSLEKRNNTDRLKAIEQKIIIQNYSEKIVLVENEKRTQKWLKNTAIGLLLLLGLLVFTNYKRIKARQQINLLKLNQAQTDLKNYVTQLHEKSSLIEKLETEIDKLNAAGQNVEYLQTLKQTTILTEDDWINFKALFEKVYPTFIAEQLQLYPDLTSAELRLLLLQKLNLSTAEMANMLGVQRNTINQTWARLRKKTGELPTV